MEAEPYAYQPLKRGSSIRLIELEKADPNAPLRGKVVEAELYQPPPYVAISYAWGASAFTESLELDGRRLAITVSLFEALCSLRRCMIASERIWADAICIDQRDDYEKAGQVRQMKATYECATKVWIWLGPEHSNSETVFRLVDVQRTVVRQLVWGLSKEDLEALQRATLESALPKDVQFRNDYTDAIVDKVRALLASEDGGLADPAVHLAVEAFFSRPYWSRLWIMQEATTLVPTMISCGDHAIDFIDLISLVITLLHLACEPEFGHYSRHSNAWKLNQFKRRREAGGPRMRLEELLEFVRGHHAADPRDRVYAAIGLVPDDGAEDFVIDYSAANTANDVLRYTSTYLLQKSGRIDWIGYNSESSSEKDPDLPSWVTDWRCWPTTEAFPKLYCDAEGNLQQVYHADRSLMAHYHGPTIDGSRLTVQGVLADVLVHLGEAAPGTMNDSRVETSWCPERRTNVYALTGETEHEAYLHTLVADVEQGATDVARRGFKMGGGVPLPANGESASEQALADPLMVMMTLKTYSVGRRLARTKRFNMMGLVSRLAELGDTVCIVAGCQVPLIIRQDEDAKWHFVGEAYMHGFMDGKAGRLVQEGELKLDTLVLE